MKNQFLIFLLFFSTAVYGQDSSFFRPFIKSVERNFLVNNEGKQDSCFFSYTLLRLDIDSNYSVYSVSFSDNAEDWQIEVLNNVKGKFNTKSLEEYVKKGRIRGLSIFFPFIIRKEAMNCNLGSRYPLISNLFFQFKNKKISGNCLFADRIELIYY